MKSSSSWLTRSLARPLAPRKPTVAIIGVGLIGGSLGQALRRSGKYRVLGIGRHPARLRRAKRLGAIDQASTDLSDAGRARIVVLCPPVDEIVPIFRKILPFLAPGTFVTDVGSVKGPILSGVAHVKGRNLIHFVGGHPLAGSHQTGIRSATPELFKGSTCVLVPLGKAPVGPIAAMWRAVGAQIRVLPAPVHDRAVAMISHLPHVLAHALIQLVAGRRDRRVLLPLLAGSFRDATRVASSDAEQWSQIFRSNAPNLRAALRVFRRELSELEHALARKNLKTRLQRSATFRRSLFDGL
jgi:prephenate dehydrogenase